MRKPTVDIAKFATPCGTITFHGLQFRRGISEREVLYSLFRELSGSAFGGYRTFLGFFVEAYRVRLTSQGAMDVAAAKLSRDFS